MNLHTAKCVPVRIGIIGLLLVIAGAAASERDDGSKAVTAIQADAEDHRYAKIKAEHAGRILATARERYDSGGLGVSQPRIRYAAVMDALAIAQSINVAWMTELQRSEYMAWRENVDRELMQLAEVLDTQSVPRVSGMDSTGDAESILKAAREDALAVDLSVLDNAKPDGKIEACLKACEKVREVLFGMQPGVSSGDWDRVIVALSLTVSALRERQQLKYTLWAEKTYRDVTAREPSGTDEAMFFYRKLSEVNLSLVVEPSLVREITRRLFELHDSLRTHEERAMVRYEAIRAIDKRKVLADF